MEEQSTKRRWEIFIFMAAGFISFLLHSAVYLLLINVGTNDTVAYSIGFGAWMTANFLLSCFVTFRERPTIMLACGFALSAFAYYLVQFILFSACQWLSAPDIIITPLVYMISFPINYLMMRRVFKGRRKRNKPKRHRERRQRRNRNR